MSSESEEETMSFRDTLAENRRAILIVAAAAFVLLILCIATILFVRSRNNDDGDQAQTTGTPTPFPTIASQAGVSGSADALVIGMGDSATISVTLDIPNSLALGGQTFPIRADRVGEDNLWAADTSAEKQAHWIYGSIINYVVGLPDNAGNRSLLEGLTAGQEIIVSTQGGRELAFSFLSRDTLASSDQSIFGQNSPGITLVLMGSAGQDRLVVRGRYVVPEASSAGQGNVVTLGETAQLDDVQFTVTGASHILDRPEAPAGFAFYLIDYQVQNVGLTALDTSRLSLSLVDGQGNQYALNPVASQLGNNPNLTGFLNSSQSAAASAGYQIPIGLSSKALNWVITRLDTGSQVQVTIPFSSGRDTLGGTAVSLARADISADLTSLILGGQIANLGDQAVLVNEADVKLETADGSFYLMLSTNPPFPWKIDPGQSVQYVVTFQRPSEATAVFTVLSQPFEITDLR